MNCDQVFDVLTRGPFPAGNPADAEVERHLTACHECRELAEALRPSVAMFHESLARDDRDALPEYHGGWREESRPSLPVAVQAMLSSDRPRAARRDAPWLEKPSTRNAAARVAVALLVLVGLGMAVRGFVGLSSNRPVDGNQLAAGTPLAGNQPDARGQQFLAALNLPVGCFRWRPAAAESGDALVPEVTLTGSHLCCTKCHSAATKSRPPVNAVAVLEQSCKACHER